MAERVLVPFEGEGSGVGELTWGQQHIWGAIRALGSPMNMCAVRTLAEGATVDEFVGELRFYLSRFQAMRTRLRFEPDGRALQVVVSSGQAVLDIQDTDSGTDPAEFAARIAEREEGAAFDHTTEFPIRMTLVRRQGVLTHLVTTLSHLATDREGGFAMYRDLLDRDPGTGHVATPVRLHPLELAARQRTPAARRQSDAALTYWANQLRTVPARRFGDPVDHGGPRYWRVQTVSPSIQLAIRAIASRLRVDVAAVLLAMYAIALDRVTGNHPSVIQLLVSNRFRPGLADIVSNISQSGLCVVDVSGVTVDEAVVRTWRASINAYKNAYFDLNGWKDLLAGAARERGDHDFGYYYNDRSSHGQDPDRVPTPADVDAARSRDSAPRWTRLDYFNERLMLTVDDAPDGLALMVQADTHYVPKADLAALVTGMAAVAVAAAFDPTVPV
jgi:hypothetical protein